MKEFLLFYEDGQEAELHFKEIVEKMTVYSFKHDHTFFPIQKEAGGNVKILEQEGITSVPVLKISDKNGKVLETVSGFAEIKRFTEEL